MKLVVDANVVISAIVKDAGTRKLLFHPSFELYTPAYLFDELEEHREEVMHKAGLTSLEFRKFTTLLGKVIEVLPSRAYDPYIEEAKKILRDPDDLPYGACAIALTVKQPGMPDPEIVNTALKDDPDLANATLDDVEECGVWTNDPHFIKKESEFFKLFRIKVWTTTTLFQLLIS